MGTDWKGRFPQNEIISLLDVHRRFNLAESTSHDLRVGEALDLIGASSIADLALGYGSSQGSEALRRAVGRLCGVAPEEVVSTQGSMLALYLLAVEACRPGDEAVLVTPCFPPTRTALLGSGVHVVDVPARFEDGYRVDIDAVGRAITGRTKLVAIASPQNPSGVATERAVIEQLLALIQRAGSEALLFVDETYREASYGSEPTVASVAGTGARVITCSSVSKAYGAPGLRVGWMTIADPDLRARIVNAKMNIVLSGSPLNEAIAARLIEERDAVLEPRRRLLQECLNVVARFVDAHSRTIAWVRPDAGALCCMRLKERAFDDGAVEHFWQLLDSGDLQLAQGTWFGESARTFRLGFGYLTLQELEAALGLLDQVLLQSERASRIGNT
jgi:aspartate/methionine/tyrosine aminotransferase